MKIEPNIAQNKILSMPFVMSASILQAYKSLSLAVFSSRSSKFPKPMLPSGLNDLQISRFKNF